MRLNIDKLFVYGTLRKGEERSHYLKDSELLQSLSIPGNLYKTKFDYPAAIFNKNSKNKIFGELYKLPNKFENILKKLDEEEGTLSNLFVRKKVTHKNESFYLYEPGAKLKDKLKPENIINNGNWLTSFGLSKKNPELFARNFEQHHKEYYRKDPDKFSDNSILLTGNNPILITCPHATVHIRNEKRKIMEIYTAAIGTILHSLLDCFCLYTNRVQNIDPNYYDECDFKKRVEKIAAENDIKFLVDLHGTGSRRKYDIYPGIGKKSEFLLGRNQILKNLFLVAKENNISIGSLELFPAVRQMTVTKFAARKLKIPSMQIEINQKLRIPKVNGDFQKLIKFFHGFLKDVSKNFHSPPNKNP